MKQLTLRGFDPELERRLRKLARERSLSLNRAALLLMRRGAGLATTTEHSADLTEGTQAIGPALDRFIGVWSDDEERAFLRSIEALERVDPDLWE